MHYCGVHWLAEKWISLCPKCIPVVLSGLIFPNERMQYGLYQLCFKKLKCMKSLFINEGLNTSKTVSHELQTSSLMSTVVHVYN